jgi:hypothetical protein
MMGVLWLVPACVRRLILTSCLHAGTQLLLALALVLLLLILSWTHATRWLLVEPICSLLLLSLQLLLVVQLLLSVLLLAHV